MSFNFMAAITICSDSGAPQNKVSQCFPICLPWSDRRLITLQYWSGFAIHWHESAMGCTCVSHPEPPSHLPPHPIPQGHPSAPALSTLSHASSLDWQFASHMIIYMFQCYSRKSSHPRIFPLSPKDCSIRLCLFCCLAYRVIITIFLNCIFMH